MNNQDKTKKKAEKLRALTDEQLVAYVENRVEKARSEGFNKGRKLVEGRKGDETNRRNSERAKRTGK
jgi:hypothetical protein